MKIYIDWDRRDWYADKNDIIDDLVGNGTLCSFNDWLETEFTGFFEELFELSDSQKKIVKENYRSELEEEFERIIKDGCFDGVTALEIDTENFNIKEL